MRFRHGARPFQQTARDLQAAHYSNPEVDRLLEAASVETDENRRRQLFRQFQQIVHDDIPSIEFGANPNITIASTEVKNHASTGEGLRGNFADLYILP